MIDFSPEYIRGLIGSSLGFLGVGYLVSYSLDRVQFLNEEKNLICSKPTLDIILEKAFPTFVSITGVIESLAVNDIRFGISSIGIGLSYYIGANLIHPLIKNVK
jgi:hypothetical protein